MKGVRKSTAAVENPALTGRGAGLCNQHQEAGGGDPVQPAIAQIA
jgi:hypothetical protein